MSTFQQLTNELNGWIKALPPSLCEININRAIKSILDSSDWSYLLTDGYITIPAKINTGTLDLTFGSAIVNISSDLKTILDNIESNIANVRIKGRQLRITSPDIKQARVIYTIFNYDSANSKLTLDQPYLGTTNTTASFEIFKSIINPFDDIISDGAYQLSIRSIDYVADIIDTRRLYLDYLVDEKDPDRRIQGNSWALSPFKYNSSGVQLYEFYPANTVNRDRVYRIKFYREAKENELVNDTDTLPKPLDSELVLLKARLISYEWCEANKGTKSELQKTNWINLIAMLSNVNNPNGYIELLDKAKLKDEELMPKAFIGDMYSNLPYYSLPHDMRDTLVFSF
jgi:hypothetical protein